MRRRKHSPGILCIVLLCLSLFACASSQSGDGLTRVDELLTRVEQVQIESLVAREKAAGAFDALGRIVAPDFHGDPVQAYQDLTAKISASKAQAQKLAISVEPMNLTADRVFRAWTNDLEKFGNTNLRQASQARLAETRARYSAVHDTAIAALVSINAFNADLSDQALFLEHDFNAASIAVIAAEVPSLTNQAHDLSRRLNECVATSKTYIGAGALRGQLATQTPTLPGDVAADVPAAAPSRNLPEPVAGTESLKPQGGGDAAQPALPPARRRPRTDGSSAQPTQVPAQQPAEQPAGPNAATQPTSQPSGKPATTPVPAPIGSDRSGEPL